MDVTVNDTCTFLNSTDGNIVYGEQIIVSALLPDMLQSDFIKAILLYVIIEKKINVLPGK